MARPVALAEKKKKWEKRPNSIKCLLSADNQKILPPAFSSGEHVLGPPDHFSKNGVLSLFLTPPQGQGMGARGLSIAHKIPLLVGFHMSPPMGGCLHNFHGGRAREVKKTGFLAKKWLSLLFFAFQVQAIGPRGLYIDHKVPSHEAFHFHLTLVSCLYIYCGGQAPYVIFENYEKMFPALLWPRHCT